MNGIPRRGFIRSVLLGSAALIAPRFVRSAAAEARLRVVFSAPAVGGRAGKPASLPGLAGSASLKGREVVLTVVNPDAAASREAEIIVRGAAVRSGSCRVLHADDIHAHNDFDNPRAVEPSVGSVNPKGGRLVHTFPAASATCLHLQLS